MLLIAVLSAEVPAGTAPSTPLPSANASAGLTLRTTHRLKPGSEPSSRDWHYWSLSVAANPGQTLDIGSLLYSVGKGGSSDPRGYSIRSSVDGFASDIAGGTLTSGAAQAPQAFSADLSGNLAYQGLTSIEIRFFNFSPNPAGNSVDWRNVSLQAVPEPSSYGLVFGVASLAAGVWKRRRSVIC